MRSTQKGSNSMIVKKLNNTSYSKTRRLIDDMTIDMYIGITVDILHDASPLEIATQIRDSWGLVAQSLYDNNNLTHKEFITCIIRIGQVVTEACNSLGVDWDIE